MLAASVVSAAMERLNNLLLSDGSPAMCIGDLRNEVVKLGLKGDQIQQFLSDIGTKCKSPGAGKNFIKLAYDIEDAIESYARHVAPVKSGGGMGCSVIKSFFAERSFRHDLHVFRRRIEQLIQVINCDDDDAYAYGPSRSQESETPIISAAHVEVTNIDSKNDIHTRRPVMIGMEGESESLKKVLLDNQNSTVFSVISICGEGGMGKTTLAKLVYDDQNLTATHFDCHAWAYIGQDFQAREILENILFSLISSTGLGWSKQEIMQLDTMDLMEQLYKYLKYRKYLIVLDDLWSAKAWETLSVAFPKDNNGSTVIITTRLNSVANDINGHIHQMKIMSFEDSWLLFKMQSGLQDVHLGEEAEEIGKQIMNQCGRNPLAIVVLGGLLREKKKLEDWIEVHHTLEQAQNQISSAGELMDVLDLYYSMLPFHLKPCFLYLGSFPPDQELNVEKLCLLWMAEGLILKKHSTQESRLMEVAEDYLQELSDRNLVSLQDDELVATRNFKSCQLHELIRDLCIVEGKREKFICGVDFGRKSERIPSIFRVAIYLNKYKHGDSVVLNMSKAKKIRSLLFFDTDECLPRQMWPREFADLKEFLWARVLHFDGIDFGVRMLPRNIRKLVYLRYLSFGGCYLKKFPSYLSNFPFLETLDLRVRRWCRMIIPNVLRKFSRLKHLYFPEEFQSDTPNKLELDGLTMLEILENFHAEICDAYDLLQLKKLYVFTGIVDGNTTDLAKVTTFIKDSIGLCHSSLVVRNFDSYSSQRLLIVKDLLECHDLYALDIKGYLCEFSLGEVIIGSNFTKMVFNGTEFRKDPMPILGKVPLLRSLVLSYDAFVGHEIACLNSDFKQLRNLELKTLNSLEKWKVEKGSMPSLISLTIDNCKKLQTLPNEVMEIKTLREIKMVSMPENFMKAEMAKKQESLGNVHVLWTTANDC